MFSYSDQWVSLPYPINNNNNVKKKKKMFKIPSVKNYIYSKAKLVLFKKKKFPRQTWTKYLVLTLRRSNMQQCAPRKRCLWKQQQWRSLVVFFSIFFTTTRKKMYSKEFLTLDRYMYDNAKNILFGHKTSDYFVLSVLL